MRYFVSVGEQMLEVDVERGRVTVDGEPVEAALSALPGTAVRHLLLDAHSYSLTAQPGDRRGRWHLALGPDRFRVEAVDERTRAIREMSGGDETEADRTVVAPMPGLVITVEVEVGQQVRAGEGVIVVEAMKMENELKAPRDGVVTRIEVQPGQTVEKGATLLVLE